MPAFRSRLSASQRRIYDRSDATTSIRLRASLPLRKSVETLADALASASSTAVTAVAQSIADEICAALDVTRVCVTVNGTRPSNPSGELHGLYTSTPGSTPTIQLWMLTAKRGQVVAYRTFLRTLLHEICHHLDYTLLGLADSFHSTGFYKRESSLFHQIGGSRIPQARKRSSAAPSRTASTHR